MLLEKVNCSCQDHVRALQKKVDISPLYQKTLRRHPGMIVVNLNKFYKERDEFVNIAYHGPLQTCKVYR